MPKVFKLNQTVMHYAVSAGNDQYVVAIDGRSPYLSETASLYTARRHAENLIERVKKRGWIKGDFSVIEVEVGAKIVTPKPDLSQPPNMNVIKTPQPQTHAEPSDNGRDALITRKAIKTIAEQLGISEKDVKITHSLWDDLGGDSLDAVEVVMAIEDEFEIEITDADAEKWNTVSDVVEFLKKIPRIDLTIR